MNNNRRIEEKYLFKLLIKIPVPWVFILAYLIGVGFQFLFPISIAFSNGNVIKSIGAGIFLAAGIIAGWSLKIFHNLKTTTTPGETSKNLVIRGPYKLSRNPMYVGLTLAYIGEAFLLLQLLPLLFLPLVWAYIQWVIIPVEEKRLHETFADEYAAYCSQVRRWL